MIADLRYSGAGPCVLLMVAVGVYLPKLPRLGLPATDYHTKLNINQNEMTYINIITGLILAAVLSVPGAMQHEATQVGEELVVEETKAAVLAPMWFELTISTLPETTPDNQLVIAEGSSSNSCSGSGALCEVQLETSAIPSTKLDELYERIDEGDYPTVQDFLDAGASYTSPQPVYTRHN